VYEGLTFKKSKEGLKKQMDDCIEVMSLSVVLADLIKVKSFTTVIAAQLRLLLCDTSKNHRTQKIIDNSLILKVIDNPKLPPLSNDYLEIETKNSKGKFINEQNMFNKKSNPIELDTWIKQKVYHIDGNRPTTILDIIKSYANKQGGAHVDSKVNGKELFATMMGEDYLNHIAKCVMEHLEYDWQSISAKIISELNSTICNN